MKIQQQNQISDCGLRIAANCPEGLKHRLSSAVYRLLFLTFIIHHSSFIIGNAQNTYQLQPSGFCPPPPGSGSFAGKTCFDIALGNDNANSCGALTGRTAQKADFTLPATHTQTYTFTPSGTVSNVRFAYVNTNGSVITAVAGGNTGNNISTAQTATVSYNTSLNTLAAGTTGTTALTADIYALYNNNATNDNNPANDRSVKLTAQVKDCACCGAPTNTGGWLAFMCYNLGAENSGLDPFTYQAGAINGDLYQWGRLKDGHQIRTSSTTNTQSTTDVPGHGDFIVASPTWRSPANNALWGTTKTATDPCPAGYKVPSQSQWASIHTGVSTNWVWIGNGYKVGSSLYLPAAGHRDTNYSSGNVITVGVNAYYWSCTSNFSLSFSKLLYFSNGDIRPSHETNHSYGMSIRCVAE